MTAFRVIFWAGYRDINVDFDDGCGGTCSHSMLRRAGRKWARDPTHIPSLEDDGHGLWATHECRQEKGKPEQRPTG